MVFGKALGFRATRLKMVTLGRPALYVCHARLAEHENLWASNAPPDRASGVS
jgi:hypothetical protein